MKPARSILAPLTALIVTCALAGSAPPGAAKGKAPVTALTGGTLIDGNGGPPVANAVVLVEGSKIVQAGPATAVKIPAGADRIDVRGKFILPGLIDCHTHLTWPFNEAQAIADDDASTTLRALFLMNLYLKSGVTAARDVGSNVPSMRALARAQESGFVDSIRLFACGALITTTGGHGDGMRGAVAVDGPWAWRQAVRQMKKDGFGQIKISPPFTPEEAQAAVEEAKAFGQRITAHGGGFSDTTPTSMTRVAVQAGVQCIEHLNEMEDDVLDLMAARGVYNVPTMAVYRALYQTGRVPPRPHWSVSLHETLFRKARERKILMGIGTDHFDMTSYPGCYFEEMKYFVELGMSPMEAIVAATKNGAVILGQADRLGTIEAGKLADIQVVKGDPLLSFDVLGSPEIVILDGKIHRY
jgi:imidazolonepropionase-like amidohydrolase